MRKYYLDYLRALATILVIVIHICSKDFEVYSNKYWVALATYKIFKKILRLIVFLFFWSVISDVYYYWNNYDINGLVDNIKEGIHHFLLTRTYFHLWYIYAIIGIYIMTPMIRVFALNATREQLMYAVSFCIVVSSVFFTYSMIFPESILVAFVQKIYGEYSFGCLGFYLLGHYLDKYDMKKKYCYIGIIIGFVCSFITVLCVIIDSRTKGGASSTYLNNMFITNVFSSAALFVFVKRKLDVPPNGVIMKMLCNIAGKSLGIYGCHACIIEYFYRHQIWNCIENYFVAVPIKLIIVLSISFFIAIVLAKIPVFGKNVT